MVINDSCSNAGSLCTASKIKLYMYPFDKKVVIQILVPPLFWLQWNPLVRNAWYTCVVTRERTLVHQYKTFHGYAVLVFRTLTSHYSNCHLQKLVEAPNHNFLLIYVAWGRHKTRLFCGGFTCWAQTSRFLRDLDVLYELLLNFWKQVWKQRTD